MYNEDLNEEDSLNILDCYFSRDSATFGMSLYINKVRSPKLSIWRNLTFVNDNPSLE